LPGNTDRVSRRQPWARPNASACASRPPGQAAALVAGGEGEVGDVAVRPAAEEVLDQLQVLEPGGPSLLLLDHEEAGALRPLAQMAFQVGADAGVEFLAGAPRRQREVGEALHQRQDERLVLRDCGTDAHASKASASSAISDAAPLSIAAACVSVRGRIRA
jgi:hypothetical protein